MNLKIFNDRQLLAATAAAQAIGILSEAIAAHGKARLIAATGAAQFDFLAALTASREIDWAKVEMFHLDEYIGLSESHPAGFRRYLRERLIAPTGMMRCHLLDGEAHPREVCDRVGRELKAGPIQVAFVGVGENGHLAFNDPPADFETEEPYIIVKLDDACRRQQVGEGWFANFDEAPAQAISMSVRQILKADRIIGIVPDQRKAQAVKNTLEEEISPLYPASILRRHHDVTLYLDQDSTSLLDLETVRQRDPRIVIETY